MPTGATPALHFHLADWLGTRRVQTDISGCPEEALTSLPFGDSLTPVPLGPCATNTADDATNLHFTGKERDPQSEGGNDYFGARYFASSTGRFLSMDPENAGAVNTDPQSWNAYSYARNNPINLIDPTGAIFCRPASGSMADQGVNLICDVTNTQYVFSSKDQQAAYSNAGYTHYDCNCDTEQDKEAWQTRNGEVHNDPIGDVLVFGAVFAGFEGLFYPSLHPDTPGGNRLPQDENRENNYPQPPSANNGNSKIGTNPNQSAALNRDIQQAQQGGATDIRVNQEQVNAQGVRVGQNRPDLQYTDRNGIRHYIEYDQDPSSGAAHAQRLKANDPAGVITTKTVK